MCNGETEIDDRLILNNLKFKFVTHITSLNNFYSPDKKCFNYLVVIIISCFEYGLFPDKLKCAKLRPILKRRENKAFFI